MQQEQEQQQQQEQQEQEQEPQQQQQQGQSEEPPHPLEVAFSSILEELQSESMVFVFLQKSDVAELT
jgi:hypothetical protein